MSNLFCQKVVSKHGRVYKRWRWEFLDKIFGNYRRQRIEDHYLDLVQQGVSDGMDTVEAHEFALWFTVLWQCKND